MTASEFKAWLDGYMLDRPNPDANVIAAKAALMTNGNISTITYPPGSRPFAPTTGSPVWPYLGTVSINAVSNTTQPDWSDFFSGQVRLGPEFEAVWDANTASLYEN